MKTPFFSVVIPTFNSGETLEKTLLSIKKQNYPRSQIEVLIVDGGSLDNTLEIAKRYKCKIILNSKTDQVFGKHIGFLKAKGRYLLNMDSDEVLKNPDSLKIRLNIFTNFPSVRGIMSSGLETPKNYSPINYYINDFGDPFSFFMYGLSQNPRFYAKGLSRIGKKVSENKDYIIFNFSSVRNMPIIELTQGGGTIDLLYAKWNLTKIRRIPGLATLIFYLLKSKGCLIAVTKNDNIIHYSSASFIKYFKKLRSRIKNNIYHTVMGKSGFVGRENFQSRWFNFKKYLFIPYSFSLIFPIKDSIYLILTRRNFIYLIHPFTCLMTSFLVVYYYFLKMLGIRPSTKGYGS